MGLYDHWPYTNFHELNLSWLLRKMEELNNVVENFVIQNAIKYADPIQWNITSQYEAHTIVVDPQTGTAYLSSRPVPAGIGLTNTDYWSVIFTLDVVSANKNLTLRDDGTNILATFPSDSGDWLIWNGTLYKVTRSINTNEAYVVGYNLDRYTIEMFIKDYIGNLSDLDTTDKDNIVEAINEIVSNLSTEVSDREGYVVYQPDVLNEASTTNIGLKAEVYNVTEDMTINAQLVIPEGAIINIDAGVTLTINSQILAGRYQIFDGDGDVIVNAAKQPFGYPEWFADDVQKACDVFSKVVLAARNYFVDGDLVLEKENFTLCGEVYGKYLGAAYKYPSRIVLNSGSLKIGKTDTISTNQFVSNITVENIAISSLASGDVIGLYGVVRANLRHIYIDTALADVGIHCYMATGSHIEDVYVQSISVDHTFMGFMTSKDLPLAGAKPASVWFRNCTYGNTGSPSSTNTYGFYITDGSDIFIDSCETILADYGIAFVSMDTHTNVDFLISNCDFDGCKKRGIYFYGCTANGAITFTNCYIAMHSSDANTYAIQFNNSTIPVILQAMQLLGNGTNTFGIAGTMHGICTAIMRNVTTPVSLTGDNDAMIDYIVNGTLTHYPV